MNPSSGKTTLADIVRLLKPEALGAFDERSLKESSFTLTTDSRTVTPRSVFFAIEGSQADGHRFIDEVDSKGALLIVGSKPHPKKLRASYITVENARLALAKTASLVNGNPSDSMKMVGITGTSGKTTSTFLIESILIAAGEKVGLIGTIECRIMGKTKPSTHTTPGPIELQALLREMKDAGCTAVVMEVSSHAIAQARTAGIAFDAMGFTNLSPEHLDFHPTMSDYFETKARLFTEYAEEAKRRSKTPVLAINAEDEYGKKLLSMADSKLVQAYETKNLEATLSGIRGSTSGIEIESKLIGAFNRSNIALAVAIAKGLRISTAVIQKGLLDITAVRGRLETVRASEKQKIKVLVDYAHKPDALEKVLESIRSIAGSSSIVTVFGCGGDRDRLKRPVMAAIAERLSDRVIVTSDNPRTESPRAIIDEIMTGFSDRSRVSIIEDRKEAIFEAIRSAPEDSVVLIAGKGHEDYQIIGTEKRHFDDREVALDALIRFTR